MDLPSPQVDPQLLRWKLARLFALHETGRELALAGLRHDHPEASHQELQRLLREKIARYRRNKWGPESS